MVIRLWNPDALKYVLYIPGLSGAHARNGTLDELNKTLKEVIQMLLENLDPGLESEFIGTRKKRVA